MSVIDRSNSLQLLDRGGLVMVPVDDITAAIAFYQQLLGLSLQFRDGERFCLLTGNGLTLGLAAHQEKNTVAVAAALKVENTESAVAWLQQAGAMMVSDVERGPHENRAVLLDPFGNELVIFSD